VMMSQGLMSQSATALPRVLVECDDPTIQDGLERVLRESGYAVSICAGPASRSSGCPLVLSGQCGLVEDAEVVVHTLDPVDPSNREVLAALARHSSDTPVVIEAHLIAEDQSGDVRRVRFPMSRATLIGAVQQGP
jgi:hypothetical protein